MSDSDSGKVLFGLVFILFVALLALCCIWNAQAQVGNRLFLPVILKNAATITTTTITTSSTTTSTIFTIPHVSGAVPPEIQVSAGIPVHVITLFGSGFRPGMMIYMGELGTYAATIISQGMPPNIASISIPAENVPGVSEATLFPCYAFIGEISGDFFFFSVVP